MTSVSPQLPVMYQPCWAAYWGLSAFNSWRIVVAFSAMKIVLLRPSVTEASRIGEKSLKTPLHWAINAPGTTQLLLGNGCASTGSEPIMPA